MEVALVLTVQKNINCHEKKNLVNHSQSYCPPAFNNRDKMGRPISRLDSGKNVIKSITRGRTPQNEGRMKEYHKIQTLFLRNMESKKKEIIEGKWSLPEFELLKDLQWVWTEKIDGTNIRILFDGSSVQFGGKTDNAQIPAKLVTHLRETFTAEKLQSVFGSEPTQVCLYGEGFGAGIQSGGNYRPDQHFILFDVKVATFWLERHNVEDVANKLEIPIVPIVGTGTLQEALAFAKTGYASTIAQNKSYVAEGLVLKPQVELFNRKGERIISKIKFKDFQ